MTTLETFAEDELRRAGWFDAGSAYGGLLGPAVLKMIAAFAEEGHSGGSAPLAVSLFKRLANWEPLQPLTGEPDEWMEVGHGHFQNKRCSRVFKNGDGPAYDIEGRVFREPSGAMFTSRESRVTVTFPYVPHTEIVDRPVAS